ncbi:hypothetical protein PENTCL1PPCAC_8409, partial [Pristionchus entomophagus]
GMAKLLGATTVLVVAALGVAIASLVINILILNQVNSSPGPTPNIDACPTPDPAIQPAVPPTQTKEEGTSTSDHLSTSPDPDAKKFSSDPKSNTSGGPETDLTSPPAIDVGGVDTTLKDPVPRPVPHTTSGVSAWQEAANRILATANFSADPCDDFYQFTCGNYLANTNLDGASRKRTSDEAQYQINLDLADYFDSMKLEDLKGKTEQYQKIFLDICVAEWEKDTTDSAVNKAKWMDLTEDLDKILDFALFPLPRFALNKNMDQLFSAMGRMERQLTGGPLMTSLVTTDFKDSTKNALYINQPAFHFDRDVYVNPQNSDKLEQYAADIRYLLVAYSRNTGRRISHDFCPDPIGQRLTDMQCAQKVAEWAVDFERSLAMASWPESERSNYQQQYTAVYWNLVAMFTDYQSLHLDSYMSALLSLKKEESEFDGYKVVLAQPTYFAALEWKFRVERVTIEEMNNYLAIHFLLESAEEYGIDIPSLDSFGNRQENKSRIRIERYQTRRGHGARRISRPQLNSKGLAATEHDAIRASCIDTLIDYMPFGPGYTYVNNRADRDDALEEVKQLVDYVVTQIGYNAKDAKICRLDGCRIAQTCNR